MIDEPLMCEIDCAFWWCPYGEYLQRMGFFGSWAVLHRRASEASFVPNGDNWRQFRTLQDGLAWLEARSRGL